MYENVEFERYEAITISHKIARFHFVGVRFVDGEERLHHWGGNYSYFIRGNEHKTIKIYNLCDFDDEDEIEIQFHRDFAIPKDAGTHDNAWIAPSGEYWLTYSNSHDLLARHLAARIYGERGGTRILEARQWLRSTEGYIIRKKQVTQSQLNAIAEIAEQASDEVAQRLFRMLSYYANRPEEVV